MARTSFTAFHVRRRFDLQIEDWNPNDSGRIVVEEGTHLTRDLALIELLKERWGEFVDIDPARQRFPGAAPLAKWPDLKGFRGRVLIVSPSRAIGDNIMFLCALAAVRDANPQLELGIAFIGGAHRAFRWDPEISVHP